jgi:anti-sigma B factor antagonist
MREFHLDTIGPSGDCAVLRVAGEVDVYTAPTLRERMLEVAAKGAVHLIVDMGGVDFLDSSGLAALVEARKRLREGGGSLIPVITNPRILRVFEITGLSYALPPRPSVPAAITADPHWSQTAESEAGSVADWCRLHDLL